MHPHSNKKWEKAFHSLPSGSTQRCPSILPLTVGGTFSCSVPQRQHNPQTPCLPLEQEQSSHPLCTADAEACLAFHHFCELPSWHIRDCLEVQTSNKVSSLNFKARLAFSSYGCFHILAWLCHCHCSGPKDCSSTGDH